MFCVVYSAPALGPAMFDDEVAMNFAAMVHGGQEFEWGEPAVSGDEITTTAKCLEIFEKDGKDRFGIAAQRLHAEIYQQGGDERRRQIGEKAGNQGAGIQGRLNFATMANPR